MPLVFFVLLVLLIAQIGFWKTLGAIIGAIGMVVLLIILAAATLAIGIRLLFGRRSGI